MKLIYHSDGVEITEIEDFDPFKIFECGQCFRWNTDENGAYLGVAFGRAAKVETRGDGAFITTTSADFDSIWRDYFDLNRDYGSIRKQIGAHPAMEAPAAYGAGIRILQQERWEALCSFIISQCNNIPRIKKIVETLCIYFGAPVEFQGKSYFTFPTAAALAKLEPQDLAPLRSGYRAPYIIEAARAVDSGALDLDRLAEADCETARAALKKLPGIGDKVANCAILFGLHMLDAFPIDTWMKKAISANFGDGFDPKIFSPYAGIAQQYLFFHARDNKIS